MLFMLKETSHKNTHSIFHYPECRALPALLAALSILGTKGKGDSWGQRSLSPRCKQGNTLQTLFVPDSDLERKGERAHVYDVEWFIYYSVKHNMRYETERHSNSQLLNIMKKRNIF